MSNMEGSLICMLGNVLVDFIVNCDEGLLQKFNLQVDGATELQDWQMALLDEIQGNIIARSPGGSALNSSRVLEWVVQGRKANSLVAFIGCIGNDEEGAFLEKEVEKSGVKFLCLRDESERTGISADLITGSYRSMCANIGASRKFQTDFLLSAPVRDYLHSASIYYVEGYFLIHSIDAVLHVAELAASNKKLFAFNVSAVYVCQQSAENIMKIIPYTDLVFGNEEEIKALCEIVDIKTSTLNENLSALSILTRNHRPEVFFTNEEFQTNRIIIVTRGNRSVLVTAGNDTSEFEVPPLKDGDLVDTVGAGDAFVGGFFALMISGKSVADCTRGGITAAAAIVQQHGCSIPTKPFAHFQ